MSINTECKVDDEGYRACVAEAEARFNERAALIAEVNEREVGQCDEDFDGETEPQALRKCLSGVRARYDAALAVARGSLKYDLNECRARFRIGDPHS